MNPNTKTIIGSPIINRTVTITPNAPNPTPDGRATPVELVKFAVILAACGNVVINENRGEITAANTNPAIKAHIAPIAERIRANGTTGIFSTVITIYS